MAASISYLGVHLGCSTLSVAQHQRRQRLGALTVESDAQRYCRGIPYEYPPPLSSSVRADDSWSKLGPANMTYIVADEQICCVWPVVYARNQQDYIPDCACASKQMLALVVLGDKLEIQGDGDST